MVAQAESVMELAAAFLCRSTFAGVQGGFARVADLLYLSPRRRFRYKNGEHYGFKQKNLCGGSGGVFISFRNSGECGG